VSALSCNRRQRTYIGFVVACHIDDKYQNRNVRMLAPHFIQDCLDPYSIEKSSFRYVTSQQTQTIYS